MARIYILKHPNASFSGFVYGVKFQNGRGSTSSELDRNALVKGSKTLQMCEDITEEYWKKKKKEESIAKAREAKEAKKKGKEKEEESEEADE